MSLSQQFLDELRSRVTLSTLIGASIKVEKAGREHKACCPFHNEKTASFTINDDKGFYHCFGCGAHGDAIRWLTDHNGLPFMDAVKDLAARVGLELPAQTPEQAARERTAQDVAQVLDEAAAFYAGQLDQTGSALEALAARGVGHDQVRKFGLGFAPSRGSITQIGIQRAQLIASGLLVEGEDGVKDRFRNRILVPIHDARGRLIGFGGRAMGEAQPKYLNSDQSAHFDKGRTLFNLHRAAPIARTARRLLLVEGYFDVIALDAAGIGEAVAPMGTAITEAQLERAWRVSETPVLLMDGDVAGRKAAVRAGVRALPAVGPGRSLKVALLPDGEDPDSFVRTCGRDAVDALVDGALSLSSFLWSAVLDDTDSGTPEGAAAVWSHLEGLAGSIVDDETRAQYLAYWRRLYSDAFPPAPVWARQEEKLPDGSVEAFSDQPEGVQERLRKAVAAWWAMRLGRIDPAADGATDAVLKLAYSAGMRVGAGVMIEGEVVEALWAFEDRLPDMKHADVVKAIQAGGARGFDCGPLLTDMRCSKRAETDLGNAERFHDRYGHQFRFTTAKGWLGWDKRRWKVLDQDKDTIPSEVLAAVFATVRAIQDEARFVRNSGYREDDNPHGMDKFIILSKTKTTSVAAELSKWGRTSESSGKLNCIAGLAKRWLTVPIEDFDTDPLAINVLNGTLRFRREKGQAATVSLEAHDRNDLNTKLAPVVYDAEAESPIYDGFLAWAQPDPDMRRYLHQWAGYSASGDISEQKLQFWYGLGANGKSTAIDLWAHVIGDYSGTIGIETFLDQGIKKRGEQASPDLARLGGVRLLRASEPERGAKLNEALIKAATGGEPMAVRALHRGFFDLQPLFKLTIGGNYKPQIPGTDEGIWRRMKLIPWNAHIADKDRDEELPAKLRAEAAGVLNHIVGGLIDWLDHGLIEPEAVREATAQYREDSDPLARFLKLCTVPDTAGRIQSSHLHEVFAAWCKAAGENEWKQKGFTNAMIDKGFTKKASNGMQWLGIRLVREVSDFVDEQGNVRAQPVDGGVGDGGASGSGAFDERHPPPPVPDDYVPGF